MKILFVPILVMCFSSNAQNFSIKEIVCKPKNKNSKIIYPIIVSGSLTADKLMNDKIREDILWDENKKASIRQILESEIKDNSLADLWYEVNFKKNGILSLAIYAEGCGAYCEGSYHYFNFDLKTGRILLLDDLLEINLIDSFKNMFLKDNAASLLEYKTSIKTSLDVKTIDSSDYKWMIELIDECIADRKIDGFYLSEKKISILNYCSFPHVIRAYEPGNGYEYSFDILKNFLKPQFRYRITEKSKTN
ncbi:MAG: hypothetical protein QM737_10395 [Ferruginibacter sp.]